MPAAWASRTRVGAGSPATSTPSARAAPGTPVATVRPAIEDQAAIHPSEHARIVLHAQDPAPAAGQLRQEVGDPGRARRVELGGRLVEDEDGRAHRDDAGDRHPLLLAARQGERLAIGEMADG